MAARDPHRFVNELDDAALERLVARLESRAKDRVFTSLFDKYAGRLSLPASARVLEVGCGTGAMMRFLVQREDFSGTALGVDQSPVFVDAARRYAREAKVSERVEFRIGDAHSLDLPDDTFDAVIAHTVISHVSDTTAVIREMARVVRPDGTLVIFDGDYSSLTYAYPDRELGRRMDNALAMAVFNNPLIMRDLPRLLPELNLQIREAWGDAVVEIGSGSFFRSFAETYAPAIVKAGLVPADEVESWLTAQLKAMDDGTFFGVCNYYTYFIRRR